MTVHMLYLPERVAQARLDFALRHLTRLTRTRVAPTELHTLTRITYATRRLEKVDGNKDGRLRRGKCHERPGGRFTFDFNL